MNSLLVHSCYKANPVTIQKLSRFPIYKRYKSSRPLKNVISSSNTTETRTPSLWRKTKKRGDLNEGQRQHGTGMSFLKPAMSNSDGLVKVKGSLKQAVNPEVSVGKGKGENVNPTGIESILENNDTKSENLKVAYSLKPSSYSQHNEQKEITIMDIEPTMENQKAFVKTSNAKEPDNMPFNSTNVEYLFENHDVAKTNVPGDFVKPLSERDRNLRNSNSWSMGIDVARKSSADVEPVTISGWSLKDQIKVNVRNDKDVQRENIRSTVSSPNLDKVGYGVRTTDIEPQTENGYATINVIGNNVKTTDIEPGVNKQYAARDQTGDDIMTKGIKWKINRDFHKQIISLITTRNMEPETYKPAIDLIGDNVKTTDIELPLKNESVPRDLSAHNVQTTNIEPGNIQEYTNDLIGNDVKNTDIEPKIYKQNAAKKLFEDDIMIKDIKPKINRVFHEKILQIIGTMENESGTKAYAARDLIGDNIKTTDIEPPLKKESAPRDPTGDDISITTNMDRIKAAAETTDMEPMIEYREARKDFDRDSIRLTSFSSWVGDTLNNTVREPQTHKEQPRPDSIKPTVMTKDGPTTIEEIFNEMDSVKQPENKSWLSFQMSKAQVDYAGATSNDVGKLNNKMKNEVNATDPVTMDTAIDVNERRNVKGTFRENISSWREAIRNSISTSQKANDQNVADVQNANKSFENTNSFQVKISGWTLEDKMGQAMQNQRGLKTVEEFFNELEATKQNKTRDAVRSSLSTSQNTNDHYVAAVQNAEKHVEKTNTYEPVTISGWSLTDQIKANVQNENEELQAAEKYFSELDAVKRNITRDDISRKIPHNISKDLDNKFIENKDAADMPTGFRAKLRENLSSWKDAVKSTLSTSQNTNHQNVAAENPLEKANTYEPVTISGWSLKDQIKANVRNDKEELQTIEKYFSELDAVKEQSDNQFSKSDDMPTGLRGKVRENITSWKDTVKSSISLSQNTDNQKGATVENKSFGKTNTDEPVKTTGWSLKHKIGVVVQNRKEELKSVEEYLNEVEDNVKENLSSWKETVRSSVSSSQNNKDTNLTTAQIQKKVKSFENLHGPVQISGWSLKDQIKAAAENKKGLKTVETHFKELKTTKERIRRDEGLWDMPIGIRAKLRENLSSWKEAVKTSISNSQISQYHKKPNAENPFEKTNTTEPVTISGWSLKDQKKATFQPVTISGWSLKDQKKAAFQPITISGWSLKDQKEEAFQNNKESLKTVQEIFNDGEVPKQNITRDDRPWKTSGIPKSVDNKIAESKETARYVDVPVWPGARFEVNGFRENLSALRDTVTSYLSTIRYRRDTDLRHNENSIEKTNTLQGPVNISGWSLKDHIAASKQTEREPHKITEKANVEANSDLNKSYPLYNVTNENPMEDKRKNIYKKHFPNAERHILNNDEGFANKEYASILGITYTRLSTAVSGFASGIINNVSAYTSSTSTLVGETPPRESGEKKSTVTELKTKGFYPTNDKTMSGNNTPKL